MQVFSSLLDIKNLNLQGKNLAVALGTFDGVHIGHQCHNASCRIG